MLLPVGRDVFSSIKHMLCLGVKGGVAGSLDHESAKLAFQRAADELSCLLMRTQTQGSPGTRLPARGCKPELPTMAADVDHDVIERLGDG